MHTDEVEEAVNAQVTEFGIYKAVDLPWIYNPFGMNLELDSISTWFDNLFMGFSHTDFCDEEY